MRDFCEWMVEVVLPTCIAYVVITLAILWVCGVL